MKYIEHPIAFYQNFIVYLSLLEEYYNYRIYMLIEYICLHRAPSGENMNEKKGKYAPLGGDEGIYILWGLFTNSNTFE